MPFAKYQFTRAGPVWSSALHAWFLLHPHWSSDLSRWSLAAVLALPIPRTADGHHPQGFILHDFVRWSPATSSYHLIPPTTLQAQNRQAKGPTKLALAAGTLASSSPPIPPPLLALALAPTSSPVTPLPTTSLLPLIDAANVPILELTTGIARRYIDANDKASTPLDWSTRAISRISPPPEDIWSRVYHKARLPKHREEFYKLVLNVFPLGARIQYFAPESQFCHACPLERQTTRHFIFSCPIAQAVWREMHRVFRLEVSVTLQQALFSWPTTATDHLGSRFGYRLQAGHAVALHVIWTSHTRAVFGSQPAHPAAARARFLADLRQYLTTVHAHALSTHHVAAFSRNWSPLVSLSPSLIFHF
jgi:hypothetical protein